ncbi:MAG: hypothetical protein EKK31_11810 [Hyphomicrobiales bacterium]|nr:MAG: hypothetical protein EKK31_11810 [Hyphomicrobiales bacterium]
MVSRHVSSPFVGDIFAIIAKIVKGKIAQIANLFDISFAMAQKESLGRDDPGRGVQQQSKTDKSVVMYQMHDHLATENSAARREIRNILRLPGGSRQELASGSQSAAVFHGTWIASYDHSGNTIPSGRPVPVSEGIKNRAESWPIERAALSGPATPGTVLSIG